LYRAIATSHRQQKPDGSYPSIIINSIDLTKMLGLIGEKRFTEVTDYLVAEVQRLARVGADFGLLAANTPHIVFGEIQQRAPIPLISIVEAACHEAQVLGLKKIGLFGIRFTMQDSSIRTYLPKPGLNCSRLEPMSRNIFTTST
jgi:aspartate racemase